MIHSWVIAKETFLLLRRDRVFLPMAGIGLGLSLMAHIMSDWTIRDFEKVFFDFGVFGFQLIGIFVAIFWGTKTIHDSRQGGAVELRLAAPISRWTWVLGKYIGIAFTLLTLAAIFLAVWQGVMLMGGFGLMTGKHLALFGLLTIMWMMIAAIAVFFACFSSGTVAIFSSLSVVAVGMLVKFVSYTLSSETSTIIRQIVRFTEVALDFQRLNIVGALSSPIFPNADELFWHAAYGVSFILFVITASCIFFERRDINV